MLHQVLLGCALTFVTTVVHASGMAFALRALRVSHIDHRNLDSAFAKAALVAALVLIMFLAALVESSVWAMTYVKVGAFTSLEPALYFSTVTYTTLGYGDIVLNDEWRLVASFQAANGTIMFGWTAALIVAFVQRVYFGSSPSHTD